MRHASFAPLLVTNLLGVANDNFLKTLASFVLLGWVSDDRTRAVLMGVTAASLVLPYILFSPLADRLTALFTKCRIVRLAKLAELPIMAFAVGGFLVHSATAVVLSIVLIGLQSSLYSPAKYALIRDIGGAERISSGMGLMEGISFLGVLGGTIAASFAADFADPRIGYAVLLVLAVLGVLSSLAIRAQEEPNREIHAINPLRYFRRARRMVARTFPGVDAVYRPRPLPAIISALCVFWAAAAMLQQGLLVYGTRVLGLDATHTGVLLVLAAVGIVSGQILAGFLGNRRDLLSWVPLFGLVAAALLALLFFAPLTPVAFGGVLLFLAFDFGFFKLPLEAEIQKRVKGPRLNTILAYTNQITFLSMFLASAAYALLGGTLGPRAFLGFLALLMAFASLRYMLANRTAMGRLLAFLLAPRYRVVADPLPAQRPLLVLPNHPALIDPLIVLTTYRATVIRPLVDAPFFAVPLFASVLGTVGAVEVPELTGKGARAGLAKAKNLKATVLETLKAGGNVLFYPSGHIYVDGREDIGNRQLAHTVSQELPPNVTVVALRTTGLWGSSWSRKGRRASPSFALTLLKGALAWPFCPFRPRRPIRIESEDLTAKIKEWSTLPRRDFNTRLTAWYNATQPSQAPAQPPPR